MELEVQKYLRSGKTLKDLEDELSVKSNRSKNHPSLILLRYDQIDSPDAHPIVVECRGIILDEADNWKVVCYSFNRFFNLGQNHAAELDWSSVKIQKKLDGSLVRAFFYGRGGPTWNFATSGNADAAGEVGFDNNLTFKELIESTGHYPDYEDSNKCFTFELTSPYNKVVISYPTVSMTLLSVRNLDTLEEEDPAIYAEKYGWKLIEEETMVAKHPKQVEWAASLMDGSKEEGYVCVDKNFNRIKIKNPQYVLLHRFKSCFSKRNLFEIALIRENSEVASYFPEYIEEFNKYESDISILINKVEEVWSSVAHIENQKEFAMLAIQKPFSGVLFAKKKNPDLLINQLVRQSRAENVWKMLYENGW